MRNIEVHRQIQRLNNLFSLISTISDDVETQSHWAKYLCVLVSGFVETSVRSIFSCYVQTKAAPTVVNFVKISLRRFQNVNMEAILQLARSFDPTWGEELQKATEGERKDAIDSIAANRNLISHGESVGITYVRIRNYYKRVLEVMELLEGKCLER
jgi:RiboL-PSP-HEPN